MQSEDHAPAAGEETANWTQVLTPYREPQWSRSLFELVVTVVPLALLWALMWVALDVSYWLCLLLAVPTAGFLMRLFMIQHDCGHGALFRQRAANDWVGRIAGVVTLTPYGFWRRTHATHHAAVGNLERRGVGDIDTLTTDEYLALSRTGRLGYRIYRHPLVMLGLIPAYLFLLHYRLPIGLMRAGWQPWLSTMGTNAAIAAVAVTMMWLVGIAPFLLIQGPVVLIAASLAMWFFYVQHQFADTQWARGGEWCFSNAALHGSSHYALPRPLAWFTGNIGVHHVHHLASRIPCYRLQQVLDDYPELVTIGRLTLVQSLRCASLALWDEGQRRLISFRELRRRGSNALAAS
jgi:omega-6 fatty acid desaturase (delta-12 desaturase)